MHFSQFYVFDYFRNEKHDISKNIHLIELIFWHKIPKSIFQKMVQWIFDILKIRPVRIFSPRAVGTQKLIFCVFAHKTISIENFKKTIGPFPADYQQKTCVKKSRKSNDPFSRYRVLRFLLTSAKKSENRCEKSHIFKNEKYFIIHITYKEHNAKNHMSIAIFVQKLVLKGGGVPP